MSNELSSLAHAELMETYLIEAIGFNGGTLVQHVFNTCPIATADTVKKGDILINRAGLVYRVKKPAKKSVLVSPRLVFPVRGHWQPRKDERCDNAEMDYYRYRIVPANLAFMIVKMNHYIQQAKARKESISRRRQSLINL